MLRRLVIVAVAAIIGMSTVPSIAAPAKACPKFSDAVGDAMALGLAPTADPALDITSVTFKPAGKGLAMALTVAKYAPRPTFAPGNRYQVEFTLGGKLITVYYKDSATRAVEENAFYQSGIKEGDTFLSAAVSASVSGNTITMVISSTDLKAALGAKVIGSQITKLRGIAYGSFVATNQDWDTADAPASLGYVIGAACR